MVTFQYGAEMLFGALYKITPETTELELNVRKCFRISGSPRKRVYPQSVLPRLDGFKVRPGKRQEETPVGRAFGSQRMDSFGLGGLLV